MMKIYSVGFDLAIDENEDINEVMDYIENVIHGEATGIYILADDVKGDITNDYPEEYKTMFEGDDNED